MSNWIHVAAIARVDRLLLNWEDRDIDFNEAFGYQISKEDPDDKWEIFREHPEMFLPAGTNGSLRMTVWQNPDDMHLDRYTVSIFGDLRDRSDCESVIEWFEQKCKEMWIRNATITVSDESNTYVSACVDDLTFVKQNWIHDHAKGSCE